MVAKFAPVAGRVQGGNQSGIVSIRDATTRLVVAFLFSFFLGGKEMASGKKYMEGLIGRRIRMTAQVADFGIRRLKGASIKTIFLKEVFDSEDYDIVKDARFDVGEVFNRVNLRVGDWVRFDARVERDHQTGGVRLLNPSQVEVIDGDNPPIGCLGAQVAAVRHFANEGDGFVTLLDLRELKTPKGVIALHRLTVEFTGSRRDLNIFPGDAVEFAGEMRGRVVRVASDPYIVAQGRRA